MKFKEFWKHFLTLDRHHAEGFTLVELIVVIAILAILGGVAVPAYSGYVEKANMTADQQLVSEVKHALELAYYSDPNGLQGMVILSPDNAPNCCENEALEVALTKAFGESWENREDLLLKYDGWSETFQASNFYDTQNGLSALLGTVDDLTGALGAFLERDDIDSLLGAGGSFNDYMTNMNASTAAEKADAAVFYVADMTAGYGADTLQNAVNAMMAAQQQPGASAETMLGAMNGELNSSLASMAALYAMAEGYATYFDESGATVATGEQTPRQILDSATSNISTNAGGYQTQAAAFEVLLNAFNDMGRVGGSTLTDYMSNGLNQDLNAYADAMKTVSSSRDAIIQNSGALGTDNYFSSEYISNLLGAYAEGGIMVYILEESGKLTISSSIDGAE